MDFRSTVKRARVIMPAAKFSAVTKAYIPILAGLVSRQNPNLFA
jgi:hypothetical protein